jgi:hypothetical protein
VRATETTVEILSGTARVASHPRSYDKHKHTTQVAHMPRTHREHAEWTPERIVAWAKSVGPKTALLVEEIMKRITHPEQGSDRGPGQSEGRRISDAHRHSLLKYAALSGVIRQWPFTRSPNSSRPS